jgi:hypothetical protein
MRTVIDLTSQTMDETTRRSFDARISRLAQYRPFDDGGTGLEACLTELTVVAAMENGGRFDSLTECREAFVILWDYEVEIDELRTVVDALVEHHSARRTGGGFALTPTFQARLQASVVTAMEIEAHAFDAWRTALLRRWPELRPEDFA